MSMSIRNQTISGVKWAAIERFSYEGINFLVGIILARLLSPEDYGTVGMLAIFLSVSRTFIDSGFTSALIRKIERTESDFSTAFIVNLLISLVVVLILLLGAPYVADFYNSPILCPILRVQSITLIVYALMSIQVTKLTTELNFKAIAKGSLISSLISGLFGIILAFLHFGVWALVAQNILSVIINLFCVCYYCRWFPKTGFSKTSFYDLFSFGKNILGASLLTTIYFNIDSLVIGKFFSPSSLGSYTRGIQIAKLPVDNINGVLGKVTYPIFAQIQNDSTRLISTYRKYIRLTSMCVMFCCVLLATIGRPLILFLLSDKWSSAVIYLQIYSFAIIVDHLCTINLSLIKIKGRSDLILRLEVIKRIISFGILVMAIPFGVIGICISKVIYSQIAVIINTYYNGKLFGLGYVTQFKDYISYFLIAIFACIPAFIITFFPLPNVAQIILGASLAFFIYCWTLRKDDCMRELYATIKEKSPRLF